MKQLILVILAVLISGCAAKPSKSEKPIKKVVVDKKYSERMGATSSRRLRAFRKADCPSSKNYWKKGTWKKLVKAGNACVMAKKWGKLHQIADHLATREPASPWGPYFYSLLAERSKNWDRSLWMITMAQKKAPQMGLLYYQEARLEWLQGNAARAVSLANKALSYDDDLIDAHLFLGQIHYQALDHKKALPHLSRVYQVESTNADVVASLADIYDVLGNSRKAIALYRKAVRAKPSSLEMRLRMAKVLEEQVKDLRGALNTYRLIKSLVRKSKVKGRLDFDIDKKIKSLEVALRQSSPTKKVSLYQSGGQK